MLSEKELVENLRKNIAQGNEKNVKGIVKKNFEMIKKIIEMPIMIPEVLQSIALSSEEDIKNIYTMDMQSLILKMRDIHLKIGENNLSQEDLLDIIECETKAFCFISKKDWEKIKMKAYIWEAANKNKFTDLDEKVNTMEEKLEMYLRLEREGQDEILEKEDIEANSKKILSGISISGKKDIEKKIRNSDIGEILKEKIRESKGCKEFCKNIDEYIELSKKSECLEEEKKEIEKKKKKIIDKIKNYGFKDDIFEKLKEDMPNKDKENKYITLFRDQIKCIKTNNYKIKKCEENCKEKKKDQKEIEEYFNIKNIRNDITKISEIHNIIMKSVNDLYKINLQIELLDKIIKSFNKIEENRNKKLIKSKRYLESLNKERKCIIEEERIRNEASNKIIDGIFYTKEEVDFVCKKLYADGDYSKSNSFYEQTKKNMYELIKYNSYIKLVCGLNKEISEEIIKRLVSEREYDALTNIVICKYDDDRLRENIMRMVAEKEIDELDKFVIRFIINYAKELEPEKYEFLIKAIIAQYINIKQKNKINIEETKWKKKLSSDVNGDFRELEETMADMYYTKENKDFAIKKIMGKMITLRNNLDKSGYFGMAVADPMEWREQKKIEWNSSKHGINKENSKYITLYSLGLKIGDDIIKPTVRAAEREESKNDI